MSGVSIELHREIEQFLVDEADLLDTHRQAEWLDLLHDDFSYRVPVPVAREEPTQDHYDAVLEFANESKSFLSMRFQRADSDFAWAERPAAFVRHFVSNLRIDELDPGRAWRVRTNVMVVRARLPESPVLASAERVDRIERHDGRLLLRERVVRLDTERPNDSQLSSIF
ncbi:aromatic-ring-hydroxylating dioxygenase subunit beta [Nocardioides sp.]|uniref:aromatic-ring-hydroxylating dioxygenase subunit beta n=1 Tax=Nocardioides sp. TaxID=35761 RepID=UPI0026092EE1|nr:aromatic-ring-hydroxylating dioxygenase subunit beta [Nocardioides sp.]MDI6909354.1 aromatic-ring-hydroxylating dioxygenase subunit beta [Nocardioides sp.]